MSDPLHTPIAFGALSRRLAEQITIGSYSRRWHVIKLKHLQRDADAITRLHVRNLMSDGQAHSARKRLMKRISLLVTFLWKAEASRG